MRGIAVIGVRPNLPSLILSQIIEDLCVLRNKIAHGDRIPDDWLKKHFRDGMNEPLCYADALREAATILVSVTWRKIMESHLQTEFSDKSVLSSYLPAEPR